MSLEEMKKAASMGAKLELCAMGTVIEAGRDAGVSRMVVTHAC